MTRPRDTQRQRLYNAEQAMGFLGDGPGKRMETVAEMQSFVDALLRSRWFKARWGVWGRIEVRDGRGRSSAAAFGQHQIRVPRWARSELVVLHEVAHCLTPRGYASHGPEFAGVFVALVRQVMGPAAAASLRDSFRSYRVRVGPAPVPRYRLKGVA